MEKKRRFKTTSSNQRLNEHAFEVPIEATEDEIAAEALNAILEWVDYGWEEVTDSEERHER